MVDRDWEIYSMTRWFVVGEKMTATVIILIIMHTFLYRRKVVNFRGSGRGGFAC